MGTATAHYHAANIGGRTYWYLLLPFHRRVFRKLLEDIEIAA
jgi:hypothetical protein